MIGPPPTGNSAKFPSQQIITKTPHVSLQPF
ncbi:hypothetical protein V1277_003553 [Bradyrhizobium sp. AZCC 1588]